ncbi:MAG TPA: triose-phosphate isomerase [Steroidobacteraceae bacterium]|nr:triose-phosphate isomerase [Steroidobacteraceae bacterium]
MRQPLVAGNWKMHGSRAENAKLIEGLAAGFPTTSVACAVCPPHVYLADVGELLRAAELPIALGAQDVSAEVQGAFTGEVSVSMLQDLGCTYVIVGHSERRKAEGENDHLVARKFDAARSKMVPILCVGERLAERRDGRTLAVIGRQLDAVLERCGAVGFGGGVIAYEPRWAIGTGMTATPEQAQEVHAFIRGHLAHHDAKIADGVRILYGGSVNPGNAAELFAMPDVDGGLIGGASLKARDFLAILAAAER